MKHYYSALIALLFTVVSLSAQTQPIKGTVFDEAGLPLPGVNVVVQGTSKGTSTDFDGKFQIAADKGQTLEFSFMGYQTNAVKVTASRTLSVNLMPDLNQLEEVVVVAYGTATKESLTGAAGVIGAKDLQKRSVSTVTQALEGSTTGLQVTSGSGQPGSSPAIRIRGFGSLNGSADPLYIVDGAPFEGGLSAIDPDDIGSVTVLKDAASTALYGARAANGVVMITTKSGKNTNGDIQVNAKVLAGAVTQAIPYYEGANPGQYYELMAEAYKNSLIDFDDTATPWADRNAAAAGVAYPGIFDQLRYNPFNVANDQIVGADGSLNPNADVIAKSLDWYEPLEQVGFRQNYNINAAGKGDTHDYFFSIGYLDERGYFADSDFSRVNARVNLNFEPTKWLKFGTNVSGSMTDSGMASGTTGNTSYANPFFFSRNMGSIYPVYLVDPATGDYILDASGQKQYDLGEGYSQYGINARPAGANNGRHVIAEIDYNDNGSKINNLSNRSYAQFTLIPGLKFSLNASIDINNYHWKEFENQIVGDGAPSGRYNEQRYTRSVKNFNQLLEYTKTFNDVHNLNVLAGHENFDRHFTSMYGMKTQLTVIGINEFDNFVTPTSLTGSSTDYRKEGYFGRLNYNYDDKYYLSGSYRYDGSSVFHSDVRWGSFYSVGGSWRASQEQFIQDIDWISNLKLRGSYGEVGNDQIGSYYAYQALYGTRPNGGDPGLRLETLGNPNLEWEKNKSYDVALEFAFLDDRIDGAIEYYGRTSEGLLYNKPIPYSLGLPDQPQNVASMVNKGWEIGLGVDIFKNTPFKWNLYMQASTVKNEIVEIPDPFISGSKRWAVGHSLYDFFLYDYYGVDSETGAALYHVWEENEDGETVRKYDADGNPELTESYNSAGKGYTGQSSIPDLFGSINNTFTYKGFQLDVFMTYGIGGQVLDYNYASLMNEGEYGNAIHIDQLKGWRQPGDQTNIPRLENGNSNLAPTSDRWLTDATYFSLRNVNFAYNFSPNLMRQWGLSSLRIYAVGENLFMSTARVGMNPQQSFAGTTSNVYLPSRIFSFGVNVGF